MNTLTPDEANVLSFEALKEKTLLALKEESLVLHDELKALMEQKEKIEYHIFRKNEELQQFKYTFFATLEQSFQGNDELLEKLHRIKIQSVDLLDILEEMIESAILTTLEKGDDIEETLQEIIKEITFQTLNANVLNAIRIRQIFSSILQSALNVVEATPNQSQLILRGTLLGMRSALHKSIEKFQHYLMYLPEEIKALYHREYQQIEAELERIHTLFGEIVAELAKTNPPEIIEELTQIGKEIPLDTDELSQLSKETVKLLQTKLSKLRQRSDKILQSASAQEAKAMGKRAWGIAKMTMEGAIRGAKEAMDKK